MRDAVRDAVRWPYGGRMKVAGLLLAAGAGLRFGGPKALARLGGELLVDRGARLLREGGCDPVLVVLGAAADGVVARAKLDGATVVAAEGWREGAGASLRAGLAAAAGLATSAGLPTAHLVDAGHVDAVVIALVDQPSLGPGAVVRLVGAGRQGAEAAVATYGGVPGHPVLLARSVWAEVATLALGEVGARGWLRANPERVRRVACDGTGSPDDVDTVEDLARLARPAARPRVSRNR